MSLPTSQEAPRKKLRPVFVGWNAFNQRFMLTDADFSTTSLLAAPYVAAISMRSLPLLQAQTASNIMDVAQQGNMLSACGPPRVRLTTMLLALRCRDLADLHAQGRYLIEARIFIQDGSGQAGVAGFRKHCTFRLSPFAATKHAWVAGNAGIVQGRRAVMERRTSKGCCRRFVWRGRCNVILSEGPSGC